MKKIFLIFLACFLFCTAPALAATNLLDIINKLYEVRADLKTPGRLNISNFSTYISDLTERAYLLTSEELHARTKEEKNILIGKSKELSALLFEIQYLLRDKMNEFGFEKKMSEDLVNSFRTAYLYIRYAQDYVIEETNRQHSIPAAGSLFKNGYPLTHLNPNYSKLEFKAGDVLLVRGTSFVSASIARVANIPTNMSHLAMVAAEPNGRLVVIESLFEKGVVKHFLEDYLMLEKSAPRAMLLRHKNAAVATVAAQEAYRLFHEAESKGKVIAFDPYMDTTSSEKIYCAELVKTAYEKADQKKTYPEYWTSFSRVQERGTFLKNLGINLKSSVAPADWDVDTRFDLVAEARDLRSLEISRIYDVALSSIFEKMENNYDYNETMKVQLQALGGVFFRKFGFLASLLPYNGLSINFVQTLVQQKLVVDHVVGFLKDKATEVKQKLGHGMTYIEMQNAARGFLDNSEKQFFSPRKNAPSPALRCSQIL